MELFGFAKDLAKEISRPAAYALVFSVMTAAISMEKSAFGYHNHSTFSGLLCFGSSSLICR